MNGYDVFCGGGWPRVIDEGTRTQRAVADELGVPAGTVSRWMKKWRSAQPVGGEDLGDLARRCLEDFSLFRSTCFRTERGERYVTTRFHARWVDLMLDTQDRGGLSCVLSPPRHGKALALDTPMWTDRGWVTAGDVKVGDSLVGPDGSWTAVEGVFPQGTVSRFRVHFSDGSWLDASGDHRWHVEDRDRSDPEVLTTLDLIGVGLSAADGRNRWRVPVADPLVMPDAELPLDPYLLGCWLGTGTSARAGLVTVLRGMEVLDDKHIPDAYMHGSIDQRLALLQGLCDTDGTVAKNGSQQSYCTTSHDLAVGFRRLVASLGGVVTERRRTTTCHKPDGSAVDGAPSWEIWFRLPEGMDGFRLERKTRRPRAPSPRNRPRRWISGIEPMDDAPMVCFAVAHPTHLFCAGNDLVVTHNSELLIHFAIWQVVRNPNVRILWIGGSLDVAKGALSSIKENLTENERLMGLFLPEGRTFKGPVWSQTKATIATRTETGIKTPTITALGKGARLLSRDADLIVFDDIVDHDSVTSKSQRDSDSQWLATQLVSRKEPYTGVVGIGSRQHHDDTWGKLIDNDRWRVLVEQAHDPGCTLPRHETPVDADHDSSCPVCAKHRHCILWPDVRPMWYLEDQRAAFNNDTLFEMVYLNITRPEGADFLTAGDIAQCQSQNRVLGHIPGGSRLVAGLDPASSADQAAFLWAVAPHPDRRGEFMRYAVDCDITVGGGLAGARDIVRRWHEMYGVDLWVVERNGYQGAILEDLDLKRLCSEHGISLRSHFTSAHNKWSADFGVTKLLHRFKNREVNLPAGDTASVERFRPFVAQCLNFGGENTKRGARKSDLVMAAWFPETVVRTWYREDGLNQVDNEWDQMPYPEPVGDLYEAVSW